MFDVVVPLEGIVLEELLFRGVKRCSRVTSTTSTTVSFRGMVLWGLSGRHVMMDARRVWHTIWCRGDIDGKSGFDPVMKIGRRKTGGGDFWSMCNGAR
jgi:hypothetical protein